MGNKEITGKKLSKKEARRQVYEKLVSALAEFKMGIKDKKFETNLQKASKLFAEDIAKAANKTSKIKPLKAAGKKEDMAEGAKVAGQ